MATEFFVELREAVLWAFWKRLRFSQVGMLYKAPTNFIYGVGMTDEQTRVSRPSTFEPGQNLVLYQTPVFPKPSSSSVELRSPSRMLVRGGLWGGLSLMGAGGLLAWDLLQMTPSMVSLTAYGVMAASFARLWPETARVMVNLPHHLKQIPWLQTPVDTLESEKQKILEDLLDTREQLSQAVGSLNNLKNLFQESLPLLSDDKRTQWEQRIQDRENGLRLLVLAFKTMDEQFSQVELLVEETKLDLAIGAVGNSSRRPQLSLAQTRRVQRVVKKMHSISSRAKKGFNSALRAYQIKNRAKA